MPLVRCDQKEMKADDGIADSASLQRKLGSQEASERLAAARALVHHPELLELAGARLPDEKSRPVREALLTSFITIGTVEAARALIPHLGSTDVALRNGVVEALQSMPEAVSCHMQALLSDPDSDVRLFSVNVLQGLNHPAVLEWLLLILARETHVNVAMTAVDIIAEIGAEEHIPAIEQARTRFPGEPYVDFVINKATQAHSSKSRMSKVR